MSGEIRDRRYRVVWNASAGAKVGLLTDSITEERLRDLMQDNGLGTDLRATTSEEDAREAARDARQDGIDVLVAVGGDGTVGTLAGELAGSPVALGILPAGSVMNIARSLGLPRTIDEAARVVATGTVRAMDVGEAAGQMFYETGSVGMNAAMFREAQRFEGGDWTSIARTVWVALRYRPARMRLELDEGVVRTTALMVTVANGPYTGVAMTVAPAARLDDGQFDVSVFRGFSKWELIRHLRAIAFGRRQYSPRISTYRSARVRITSASPLPCRIDSHDLGTTPVDFRVRPGALRVIVPASEAVSG